MDDSDYVTIVKTQDPFKFLVCVIKYQPRDDDYVQTRVSQPLSAIAAETLAKSWAAALKLEIRR
jgi:hypothetical protein